jgi:hypothetical protein
MCLGLRATGAITHRDQACIDLDDRYAPEAHGGARSNADAMRQIGESTALADPVTRPSAATVTRYLECDR